MKQISSNVEICMAGKPNQFSRLNIDCQLLITDLLDVPSLISLAETNEHFFILVSDVVTRRYSKTVVQIISPFYNIEDHVHEKDDTLTIQHFETAIKFIKLFGHLISHIQIKYDSIFRNSAKDLNQMINNCCSKTLVQIDVHSVQDDFFQDMIKPFEKVQTLSIGGHFKNLGSDKVHFGDLFPSLRNLSLKDVQVSDTSIIERKFMHLEHLSMHIFKYDDHRRFTESDLRKIITNNPQIKSLILVHCTRGSLNLVNELLPDLRSLGLVYYTEYIFEIHPEIVFQQLRSFSIEKSSHSLPKNISFKRLERFYTDSFPQECNRWIELVQKSKHLEKLHVKDGLISNDHLSRLASSNLYLNEISLVCNKDVNDEAIIQFVENNGNVVKIDISKNMPGLLTMVAETFRKDFANDWRINESEYKVSLDKSER